MYVQQWLGDRWRLQPVEQTEYSRNNQCIDCSCQLQQLMDLLGETEVWATAQ